MKRGDQLRGSGWTRCILAPVRAIWRIARPRTAGECVGDGLVRGAAHVSLPRATADAQQDFRGGRDQCFITGASFLNTKRANHLGIAGVEAPSDATDGHLVRGTAERPLGQLARREALPRRNWAAVCNAEGRGGAQRTGRRAPARGPNADVAQVAGGDSDVEVVEAALARGFGQTRRYGAAAVVERDGPHHDAAEAVIVGVVDLELQRFCIVV